MCPGGTEALQKGAKECTLCRPGMWHYANLKLEREYVLELTVWEKGGVWTSILVLNRYAQAPPSDHVSNLQQWLLPDPLGPGKLWCMPREPLLPCERCVALFPPRENEVVCFKKKNVMQMFGDKNIFLPQSPDVNPIQCPSDAFCPAGSLAPSYCMETFFRKAGETCEFAPVTIALLVIGGGGK